MRSLRSALITGATLAASLVAGPGCSNTNVELEPAPSVAIPPEKPIGESGNPMLGPPKKATLGQPSNPGGAP